MEKRLPRVAITHGDMNGISYEILIKTFAEPMILDLVCPIIYGSSRAYEYWSKLLKIDNDTPWKIIKHPREAKQGEINLIDVCKDPIEISPGNISTEAGHAAFKALEMAIEDTNQGQCDILVTAPINKAAMPQDVFPYKGHTDYIATKLGIDPKEVLMILFSNNTRVALATTHCAVKDIPQLLSKELLINKLSLLERSLVQDFEIVKPRIALLSLNPHAGDKGLMGNEEETLLKPVIEECISQNIFTFGPYAPDGFFGSDQMFLFDGILALYHDQGLAPFKALFMNSGVNFTAGLPIVRTSPDHGTGYDIVGKGIADPTSMRAAIFAGLDIFRSRKRFQRATRNPLRKAKFDRGNDNEKLDPIEEDAD
ncbi:MAG: 4-hydroxythreonine-4-phosphate dehydrogenase PdxA [Porphyromonadaceae bacterium]|nr:4-hydroxythreonine-4-phosphate dehydrogenase PdxA [Porphyromonadaceae bacterium]